MEFAIYMLIFMFMANVLTFGMAYRKYQKVELVHKDITEFRSDLIKLASQRKRRF